MKFTKKDLAMIQALLKHRIQIVILSNTEIELRESTISFAVWLEVELIEGKSLYKLITKQLKRQIKLDSNNERYFEYISDLRAILKSIKNAVKNIE